MVGRPSWAVPDARRNIDRCKNRHTHTPKHTHTLSHRERYTHTYTFKERNKQGEIAHNDEKTRSSPRGPLCTVGPFVCCAFLFVLIECFDRLAHPLEENATCHHADGAARARTAVIISQSVLVVGKIDRYSSRSINHRVLGRALVVVESSSASAFVQPTATDIMRSCLHVMMGLIA